MVLDQECPHQAEKKLSLEEDKKVEKNYQPKPSLFLKKRSEFLSVRDSGRSVKSKFFIINFLYSTKKEIKVGLTVSRKIGNSVKRNYVKRILRAIIRNNYSKIPENLNFEIIPKKNIELRKFAKIEIDLLSVFQNLEN